MSSQLNMMVWAGYDDAEASRELRARHDLSLEVVTLEDDEAVGRALRDGGLGRIDLAGIEQSFASALAEEGLLSRLDLARLPNAARYEPAIVEAAAFDDAGWTWSAPFVWGTHPLIYSPELLTDPPTSWFDLFSAELRGKVVIYDDPIQQIYQWGALLGFAAPSRIDRGQLERVISLLRDLQAGAALLTSDVLGPLVSGAAWAATAGYEGLLRQADALGIELRATRPGEGAMGWLDSWCIPAGAPNESLAYEWIDWMIGSSAQSVVCSKLACGAVNTDAGQALAGSSWDGPEHGNLAGALALTLELPPRVARDGITTIADWKAAWTRLREPV